MACIFISRMQKGWLMMAGLTVISATAQAGPIRDWLQKRQSARHEQVSAAADDVKVWRDVAYGSDPRQRMDVYAPQQSANAPAMPVIFMVHGGAWAMGDKSRDAVVENKVTHWAGRGVVLVSINYRMLPDAAPLDQAKDVAAALSKAQEKAAQWGADPQRFVLMGHSAGAHLVALLTASPQATLDAGARPWLGAVLLDSAALDVVAIMRAPHHLPLYDKAFATDEAVWRAASPLQMLKSTAPPMLAVCSSRRADSCQQAQAFADQAARIGVKVQRLPQDMSHGDINQELGLNNPYTQAVDDFIEHLPGFKPAATP